jgi:ABC-type polysaccharide/polyol phosphate transport system ATPase subunit
LLALTRLSIAVEHPRVARASALAAAPRAVVVDHLSKTFRLPHRSYSTLKERALHPFRSRTFDELHAVDNVSVDIARGEFFGIVGRNGSGKSTLLKCLAEIYQPDAGSVSVAGRLSPFIELGVGFNADLTARDNVLINAVMLGLSRREAKRRFDEIIAFAELEEFIDLPLKNYSSGMGVRLGFSVAVQVDADVLLVDEVLAVGDAAFQQKCFEQFQQLKSAGRTIIFVTHDMGAVERFCDRAMLLERGNMTELGEPHAITLAYNQLNFGRLVHDEVEDNRYGDQAVCEIDGAWFERRGERVTTIAMGEPLEIVMGVSFRGSVENPIFAIALRNDAGHTVFATSTQWLEIDTGVFREGDAVEVRIALESWLAPSIYKLTPSVARDGAGTNALDLREDLVTLAVHGTKTTGGIVYIPHRIEVERG